MGQHDATAPGMGAYDLIGPLDDLVPWHEFQRDDHELHAIGPEKQKVITAGTFEVPPIIVQGIRSETGGRKIFIDQGVPAIAVLRDTFRRMGIVALVMIADAQHIWYVPFDLVKHLAPELPFDVEIGLGKVPFMQHQDTVQPVLVLQYPLHLLAKTVTLIRDTKMLARPLQA